MAVFCVVHGVDKRYRIYLMYR
ncbi:hypothetical protein CHELA1G11_13173 [Hyphomicrobiales bacterium]|nr:hypothetical protein CHELA1G11_13173 [Hyphomicrobiales bacterium]